MKTRNAVGAFLFGLLACDGGREGDRCNPNLSHNDCDDGLVCVQPATCVESYCCPANGGPSSNAFCHGESCPAPDAGPDTGRMSDGAGDG
jgi:hypothetical protein